MKKSFLTLLLTILIIVSLTITCIYILYNKVYLKNLNKYAIKWYNDYGEISKSTSVNVLKNMGYMEKNFINNMFDGNGCKIITFQDENVKIKNSDCELDKKLNKIPYFKIKVITNDGKTELKNNESTNSEVKLSVELKNISDNLEYTWEENGTVISNAKELVITKSENVKSEYKIFITSNDQTYSRSYTITFDFEKPVISDKKCDNNGFYATYLDGDNVVDSKYYISTTKEDNVDISNFKDYEELEIENFKKYYVYSLGIDSAGNYSDIEYLGEYQKELILIYEEDPEIDE